MSKIEKDFDKAVDIIKKGGVIVAPTDTIYGILADALNEESVKRVYLLKERSPEKPFIILIPDITYLSFFGIKPSEKEKKLLKKRGVTVVIDIPDKKFNYLHRGKRSLAFRIPDNDEVIEFIRKTEKPLIAPSANPEGEEPAKNIKEAVNYFGDKVDMYIDRGDLYGKPSTIVKVNGKLRILREGSVSEEELKKMI
ncbi:L-threonylcarbamoyladenylate synthase [Persephonella hydrogeniphila]|uniref:L-threonylcarbamoyladenylate synthase n=1 Tax=Persephonella hydrogeniphila TaxID=198703 RepID=A0A285NHI7_9AQUI|nr:L-threonylcarbamoyladenylate synthase [Persephonella hydrogeniphila]SNZ08905.1 L-threonylcarbamoyladenylate synthase [Persephonella hydrogeniphila]